MQSSYINDGDVKTSKKKEGDLHAWSYCVGYTFVGHVELEWKSYNNIYP